MVGSSKWPSGLSLSITSYIQTSHRFWTWEMIFHACRLELVLLSFTDDSMPSWDQSHPAFRTHQSPTFSPKNIQCLCLGEKNKPSWYVKSVPFIFLKLRMFNSSLQIHVPLRKSHCQVNIEFCISFSRFFSWTNSKTTGQSFFTLLSRLRMKILLITIRKKVTTLLNAYGIALLGPSHTLSHLIFMATLKQFGILVLLTTNSMLFPTPVSFSGRCAQPTEIF